MKVSRKTPTFLQQIRRLTGPVRLYLLGFVSFVFGLIAWLAGSSLVSNIFIALTAFCLALAFLIEFIQYIGSIWDSIFAKVLVGFLGLLSIACLWIARMLSLQIINFVIPVNPSNFPLSSLALTYFIVGMLWLALALLFFLLVALGMMLRSLFEYEEPKQIFSVLEGESSKGRELRKEKSIVPDKSLYSGWRAGGALAIGAIILSSISIPLSNTSESILFVRTLIAQTDHFANSTCSNHDPSAGERVAFLDGNRISVAIPDGQTSYNFEIRNCDP